VTIKEPARTGGARTTTVYAPNVPLPAVAVTYPGPAAGHPDAAAMDVLDAILSSGESSRLYRALVYEQQVATQAAVDNTQNAQAGYFAPLAIAAGGKDVAVVEAALLKELARVRDAEVSAAELEEAKTELLASALRERETADGLAQALGQAIILTGDARNADRELAQLQAVTAADVRRVARKYLADDQRVVIRYLDESQRPAGAPPEPAPPAPPKVAALTGRSRRRSSPWRPRGSASDRPRRRRRARW
jgi:zinc protease